MFDKLLIFALLCFNWTQGSSQDEKKYKHDEKYALVSFTSQNFLEKPEYLKNKKTSSFKKIFTLYEIHDFVSPRRKDNLKQNYLSTEFQIETKGGAVYQIPRGEAFLFRNVTSIENSLDSLPNSLFQTTNFTDLFLDQPQLQPNSQNFCTFWRQITVVWNLIKKRQFSRLMFVLQYRFKRISQIKKLFFAIGILLFYFFKILDFFEFISFFVEGMGALVVTNYFALQL